MSWVVPQTSWEKHGTGFHFTPPILFADTRGSEQTSLFIGSYLQDEGCGKLQSHGWLFAKKFLKVSLCLSKQ